MRDRQIEILRIIVEDYMKSGNPIGSSYLMKTYELPFSSATIRNEMAQLEHLGLLEKTHISSGRIPSTIGFRLYVKNFVNDAIFARNQLVEFEQLFGRGQLLQDVVFNAVKLLATMTNCTVFYLGPTVSQRKFDNIRIILQDDSRAILMMTTMSGEVSTEIFPIFDAFSFSILEKIAVICNERLHGELLIRVIKILEYEILPQFQNIVSNFEFLKRVIISVVEKIMSQALITSGIANVLRNNDEISRQSKLEILDALESSETLNHLVKTDVPGHKILFGEEIYKISNHDCVIISNSFVTYGGIASISLIGPIRLNYPEVIQILDYISEQIANY